MKTTNRRVACAPMKTNSIKATVKGGVPVIEQMEKLQKLEVVYPTADWEYVAGQSVYVPGECVVHDWAKKVYKVEDGKPFILVPYDIICGVEDVQLTEIAAEGEVQGLPTE